MRNNWVDKISISNLAVRTIIGAHSYEQQITQQLIIDLDYSVDINRAAEKDLLSDTHDYAKICASIIEFADNARYRLLETFAKKISDYLKNKFKINIINLSVTKHPSDLPGVAITVEMGTRHRKHARSVA